MNTDFVVGKVYPISEFLSVRCIETSFDTVTFKLLLKARKAQKLHVKISCRHDGLTITILRIDFNSKLDVLHYIRDHVTVTWSLDMEAPTLSQEIMRGYSKLGAYVIDDLEFLEFQAEVDSIPPGDDNYSALLIHLMQYTQF